MIPALTLETLFQEQGKKLKLTWEAGQNAKDRLLEPTTALYPGMALVGHLNLIHPNRVQVIGNNENIYLKEINKGEREKLYRALFNPEQNATVAVILAGSIETDPQLESLADNARIGLFRTQTPSPLIIDHLQYYLTRALAPRLTIHGVYMEVMGMGVLITGEPGIGKSELALELLSRNHRLIADDAVELIRVGPDVLVGQCPQTLSHYLEVRGLGILDARMMFGETAVRHKKRLHLIVRLEQFKKEQMAEVDRLQAEQMTHNILDVGIPEVILYVAPGRNLAILVEAATRSYILKMWDINPLQSFIEKQHELIKKSTR